MLKSITASFDERMRLLLDPHYVSTSPATSSAASSTSSAASRKASVAAAEDAAAVVAMGKKRERGDDAVAAAAEADSLKERSASVGGSPRQKLSIKVGEQRFLNLIPNVHEL